MLLVSVTHFDDQITSAGEVVTVYVVHVKYSSKSFYTLSKRYSDFFDLYNIMKDSLPPSYKFPNKSLFNTSAQFTKERRIKGFDELLKLLTKLDPFPLPLQRFLEMDERVSFGSRKNFAFLAFPVPKRDSLIISNSKPISPRARANSRRGSEISSSIVQSSSVDQNAEDSLTGYVSESSDLESRIDSRIKSDFPSILSSSFKIAVVVYIVFVVLSIVDVSRTSLSQMLVTLLALGLLLAFIRVISFKMEARNSSSTSGKTLPHEAPGAS